MIGLLQTFGHWWVDHTRMFAAIAVVGILMAWLIPTFIAILAGSKQKQEERIQNAKMLAKEQGRPKTWSI